MLGKIIAVFAVLVACLALPAHGAPKDGTTGKPIDSEPAPIVILAFDTDQTSIPPGQSVLLSWASSGARSCNASGAWEGKTEVQGAFTTLPILEDSSFTLTCKNKGASDSKTVNILISQSNPTPVPEPEPLPEPEPAPEPDPAPTPTLQLAIDQNEVDEGDMVALSWQATDVDACAASGAWSGTRPATGQEAVSVDRFSTFTLSCSAGDTTLSQMVTVAVRNLFLSWQPPSENVDGTSLTDLAGFKIYSLDGSAYTFEADIASPTSNTAALAKAPGEYLLVMTAYDLQGNESAYSNAVTKLSP